MLLVQFSILLADLGPLQFHIGRAGRLIYNNNNNKITTITMKIITITETITITILTITKAIIMII